MPSWHITRTSPKLLQSTKFLWPIDRKTGVEWGLSYWLTRHRDSQSQVTNRHYGYTWERRYAFLTYHANLPEATKHQTPLALSSVYRKTKVVWGHSYWLTDTVHYGYTSTETRNSTVSSRRRRRRRFFCDSHSLPILHRNLRHGIIIYQTININS